MPSTLTTQALATRMFSELAETAVSALAQDLAHTAPSSGLVFLVGDLGAGKTTFARAFLRGLGVTGPVRSPTYTLIEPYDFTDGQNGPRRVLHLDLYRLGSPEELDYLGLRDEFDQALILIEWAVRAEPELPLPDLEISLAMAAPTVPDLRRLVLSARTAQGTDWLDACQSRNDEREV